MTKRGRSQGSGEKVSKKYIHVCICNSIGLSVFISLAPLPPFVENCSGSSRQPKMDGWVCKLLRAEFGRVMYSVAVRLIQ